MTASAVEADVVQVPPLTAQARAIIVAHLPPEQMSALPDPVQDRTGFLDALSCGLSLLSLYRNRLTESM